MNLFESETKHTTGNLLFYGSFAICILNIGFGVAAEKYL